MESTRRQDALWALLACAFVAALLFVRISAFGIWDPWELTAADAARHLAAGEPVAGPASLSTWLVSLGFRSFGVHEWAGRTPIALAGIITALLAYLIATRFADARTGFYAALITGTSPLFVFNSRAMLGDAPAFAAHTAVGLCAICAVFQPRKHTRSSQLYTLLWLGLLLGSVALAVRARGALLGALPPLLAVALVALLARAATPKDSRNATTNALATYVVTGVALALGLLVARDVVRDSAELSLWLGGRAALATAPTFDSVVETVFHAFAPWSALVPLAMGRIWQQSARVHESSQSAAVDGASAEPLGLVVLLWAAFGYGAQTLFLSRYGKEVSFLPVAALAVLVALFIRDVEQRGAASWALGLSAFFLAGLILRDYAIYPNGPLHGMPLSNFDVPKVWNPKGEWALALGSFAALALCGLSVAPDGAPLSLRAPYAFLREQWRRSWPHKLWLLALALTLLSLGVFGALAFAIPQQLQLSTIGAKWVRRLLFVPLLIPVGITAYQLMLFAFGKLGDKRLVPMLIAGAGVGLYASQGFLPALSEHFSPREVYETYNALAKPGEGLGEYHVGGRAAAYYAKGKITELAGVSDLVAHLKSPGRRWAAFPADELSNIDREYRRSTGEHVIIADARSARVLLGTNLPMKGKPDESLLSRAVRKTVPNNIQHKIEANFDDRIQLLGYDLVLPHGQYVGAGESFKVIWYFRCTASVGGDYRIFEHIDGEGQRIHGDHDPVDGKYPARLWDEGDIIVDEQELDVPASYRHGDYSIFMGFYSGETRLHVKSGPSDGEDRVRVGVLRIQ